MKLSRREKFLIIVLIIAVIGYIGFKYVPFGEIFSLEELKAEHAQKKQAYDAMSQNITQKNVFEEKARSLTEEISNLNVISILQQEKVIVFLNNYFAKSNIDVSGISFTDASVVEMSHIPEQEELKEISSLEKIMNDIKETPQSEVSTEGNESTQGSGDTKQPSMSARRISANITFESSYNDMLNFIDAIQNNPVDISITNISTLTPGGNLLQGNMALNFYEIPKLDDFTETNTDWIWNDLVPFGKNNPFSMEGGSLLGSSGGNYDFYMSVVPESSDLPTVMLGKAGHAQRTTYVYADSNTTENISFVFNKEGDKYYYRYGTRNSSYPSGGGWEEFTPVSSGNVYIKIYSSSRNSTTDSSGVNISVTNTSGLNIRFDIEGDDSSNPRIYFKEPRELIITRR
ncbi:MAG TPA: hypothetical protein PLA73_09380 [Sedimentibacter sp.]|nr:hypothetical protein [Sedimentibacter sp.]